MESQELTMQNTTPGKPGRVTEFELRLPRRKEIALPKVEAEPLRRAAEDVVLTGIGLTVLAGRAVARTLREARSAGEEAAEHPGPVTRALVGLVGKKSSTSQAPLTHNIPVLPIAGYNALTADEIVTRLEGLSEEQLGIVRAYEETHEKRAEVLQAIDARLGAC